jgi:hypothetical protein
MSFKALSWAWEANTGSPGRKLVLVGLAQFANDKNECWPAQATIAERTEQSERTVREHLAWLEEQGFLSRQARTGAGKQFDSDIIRLHLERLEPKAKEERKPAANFAAGENGQTDPVEPSASGEKPQEPAANFAGIQRQISPPNLHMNLQGVHAYLRCLIHDWMHKKLYALLRIVNKTHRGDRTRCHTQIFKETFG